MAIAGAMALGMKRQKKLSGASVRG
ncbi:hypothetical protein [Nostoc sp. CHAB 5715]